MASRHAATWLRDGEGKKFIKFISIGFLLVCFLFYFVRDSGAGEKHSQIRGSPRLHGFHRAMFAFRPAGAR
jgi:hypothetical protein